MTPGYYSFDVPVETDTLYLSGAGGGGGGAGANSVDKKFTKTTGTTSWTVPNGVNQITFKIYGAAGGGGGGYARLTSDNCAGSKAILLPAIADNGEDLCAYDANDFRDSLFVEYIEDYTTPSSGSTACWDFKDLTTGSDYFLCNYSGAFMLCRDYYKHQLNLSSDKKTRLLTKSEILRLKDIANFPTDAGLFDELGACCVTCTNFNLKKCNAKGMNCKSPTSTECDPHQIFYQQNESMSEASFDSIFFAVDYILSGDETVGTYYSGHANNTTGQVKCVYVRKNWFQYSAAGGASGSVFEKTIQVSPGDTVVFTIGKGGLGGNAGYSGNQGAITKIEHRKKGGEIVSYEVQGGLGGKAANSTSNGALYTQSELNPDYSCSIITKNSSGTIISKLNTACTKISSQGSSPTVINGGSGGKIEEFSNEEAKGGQIDSDYGNGTAAGQNGTTYGFGGGGGTCPRGVRTPSSCKKGGNGADGKIDITYKVILPGGGGGGAAASGYDKDNIDHEIVLKVKKGSRLMFKVGAGGKGGFVNSDGEDGQATVIGKDNIVLGGGKGGKTSTGAQKTALKGGSGGKGGELEISGVEAVQNNASSISDANGLDGLSGQTLKDGTTTYLNYGLDGGSGGSTFLGHLKPETSQESCGGGIINLDEKTSNCQTGSIKDGQNGKTHDAMSENEEENPSGIYGGGGGGGGGATLNSIELGKGGDGADGYLRIRWGY